ncbi:hypothetical protein [Nocardia sp. NPDC052112]|uniref:hypothetical protein n=1 Tax=Nocardia sp. NPDC052112 TaxID=3155646 RepID=UPI00342693A2
MRPTVDQQGVSARPSQTIPAKVAAAASTGPGRRSLAEPTIRRTALRRCGAPDFVSDVRLPSQRRTNPIVPMMSVAISTPGP